MNKPRIIRTKSIDGGGATGVATLNFHDLETLGNKIIGESMARLEAIEQKKKSLEEQIRQRHGSMESEYAGRREELENELAKAREGISVFVENGRQEGFSQGKKEGHEEGLANGHREGFEKGYGEGREAGYKEGRETEIGRIQEETSNLIPTIRSLSSELSTKRHELVLAARTELIRLAIKVAEKIVQREIQQIDQAVLTNVSKAVDMVFHRNKVTVQLHPDDIGMVEKYAEETLEIFNVFQEFELVAVRDISRGGCRIASGPGLVDLSIETQLKVIEHGLIEAAKGQNVLENAPESQSSDTPEVDPDLEFSSNDQPARDAEEGSAAKEDVEVEVEVEDQQLAEEIAS